MKEKYRDNNGISPKVVHRMGKLHSDTHSCDNYREASKKSQSHKMTTDTLMEVMRRRKRESL